MALGSAEPFRPPTVASLSVRVVVDCSGGASAAGMVKEMPVKVVFSNAGSRPTCEA